MPSSTATPRKEEGASWPASTLSTVKRWSVLSFTRVSLTLYFLNVTKCAFNPTVFQWKNQINKNNILCPSDGQVFDVWIGLIGIGVNPTIFKWIHEGPVNFTYWNPNQPVNPTQGTHCVLYSGEVCFPLLPAVCNIRLVDVSRAIFWHTCPSADARLADR